MEDLEGNKLTATNTTAKTDNLYCSGCGNDIKKGDYITICSENGNFTDAYCRNCGSDNNMSEIATHEAGLDAAFGIGQW